MGHLESLTGIMECSFANLPSVDQALAPLKHSHNRFSPSNQGAVAQGNTIFPKIYTPYTEYRV